MTYINEKRLIYLVHQYFKTRSFVEKRVYAQNKNAIKVKLLPWKGSLLCTPELQAVRPRPPSELPLNICLLPKMKQLHILYILISPPSYISRKRLFILLYTMVYCLLFSFNLITSSKGFSYLFSRLYWFPMNKELITI